MGVYQVTCTTRGGGAGHEHITHVGAIRDRHRQDADTAVRASVDVEQVSVKRRRVPVCGETRRL